MWRLWGEFGLGLKIGTILGFVGLVLGMGGVVAGSGWIGIAVFVLVCGFVYGLLWYSFRSEVRRLKLQKTGKPGAAQILEVHETGKTVQNNYPVAKLRLRVTPDHGGEPYDTTTEVIMDRFEIPAYQPGATIRVLIDPRHPDEVAVA